MNRTILFGITLLVASIGISLVGSQKESQAGYGCHGAYGCWGGHFPLIRRVVHHRWHRWSGCYGYYGCAGRYVCSGYRTCYGCYGCGGYTCAGYTCGGYTCGGYTCGGYTCGGYTCGGYTCGGCWGGRVIDETPVEIRSDAPTEAQPTPATDSPPAEDSARLNIRVPADAQVFINDLPTKSTGPNRRYFSRGLEQGRKYRYEVRAQINREGRTVDRTEVVMLTAGKRADVNFQFDEAALALRSAESEANTVGPR